MAEPTDFKKLTDPAIPEQDASVALDDLLHTVDVSDTSGGAAGTSKRTTVEKIFDVVEANLPITESGTWTPIFSDAGAALSNPVLIDAYYSRQGDVVTCTISGTVDVDFSIGIAGAFETTFPIATTTQNAIGTATLLNENQNNGVVRNKEIRFTSSDNAFNTSAEFYAVFQYTIN
jgi:hypothetical protein